MSTLDMGYNLDMLSIKITGVKTFNLQGGRGEFRNEISRYTTWLGALDRRICALTAYVSERLQDAAVVRPALAFQRCEIFAYPSNFVTVPGSLSQIAVGIDGVWGINAGRAFEYNAITKSWDAIPAPDLDAIWAGGDGVFARKCLPPVLEGALSRDPAAPASSRGLICGGASDDAIRGGDAPVRGYHHFVSTR